jgi:hypothetical protein
MRVLQTKIVYLHSSFFLVIAKGFDSSFRLVLGNPVFSLVACDPVQQGTHRTWELSGIRDLRG